jgi:NAD(P)-dependent dehydrogenase (short-subunit alcohol dehydrogenase family)
MIAQVVLITGALTGIGRETALAFGREHARIIVSGRREPEGLALVTELRLCKRLLPHSAGLMLR